MRLKIHREPYWLDLPSFALRLKVKPASTAIVAWARAAAIRELSLPGATSDERRGLIEAAFARALGRAAIIEWEGVTAEDDAPAPLGDDTIGALMDLYPIGEMFIAVYLAPIEEIAAEKNGSPPARSGTGAAGEAIADGANGKTLHAPPASG